MPEEGIGRRGRRWRTQTSIQGLRRSGAMSLPNLLEGGRRSFFPLRSLPLYLCLFLSLLWGYSPPVRAVTFSSVRDSVRGSIIESQVGFPWPEGLGRNSYRTGVSPFVPGSYQGLTQTKDWALIRLSGAVKGSSVAIDRDGSFYVCTSEDNSGTLHGFTGRGTYKTIGNDQDYKVPAGEIIGSPVLADFGNGTYIIIGDSKVNDQQYDDSHVRGFNAWGEQLWTYPVIDEKNTQPSLLGQVRSSVTVGAAGRIYFGTSARVGQQVGGGNTTLTSLNGSTGAERWRFPLPEAVKSTPVVDGDDVYVLSGGVLHALRERGTWDSPRVELAWSLRLSAAGEDYGSSPCVAEGDLLFVGAGQTLFAVNVSSGEKMHSFRTGGPIYSSPTVDPDKQNVYFGSDEGSFYALSLELELKWKYESNTRIRTKPLVLGDGTVAIGVDGTERSLPSLEFLDPSSRPDTRGTISPFTSFIVPTATTRQLFAASPSVSAEGHVLFGTADGHLYALGGRGGCPKGSRTNANVSTPADLSHFCLACPSGSYSSSAGSESCDTCPFGKWSAGEAKSFCFVCEVPVWCRGEDQCQEGREGTACSTCQDGFYQLNKACKVCPDASFGTTVLVGLATVLLLYLVYRHTGVSAYTTGTKFTHELSIGDKIRVKMKAPDGKRKFIEREVIQINHDYSCVVDSPFSTYNGTKLRFQFLKYSRTGKSKWKGGTGLITIIAPKPVEDSTEESTTLLSEAENLDNASAPSSTDLASATTQQSIVLAGSKVELAPLEVTDLDAQISPVRSRPPEITLGQHPEEQSPDLDLEGGSGGTSLKVRHVAKDEAGGRPASSADFVDECQGGGSLSFPSSPTKASSPRKSPRKKNVGAGRTSVKAADQDTGGLPGGSQVVTGKLTSGMQIFGTAMVIAIGYYQMTAIFFTFELNWPPQVKSVMDDFGSVFSLSIPDLATSPECDWDFGFYSKWAFSVLTPLTLLLAFYFWYKVSGKKFQDPAKKRSAQDRCVTSAVILMTIMYVFVTAKTIEPLVCTAQDDGTNTMDASPDILCCNFFTDGCIKDEEKEYLFISSVALFFFFLYGVGLPLFLLRKMARAKRFNQLGEVLFIQRYGWLYLRFNRDFYFWEIIIMIRKLCIVLIKVIWAKAPTTQAKCSLATLCIALALHARTKPFVCYNCLKCRKKRCRHWSANDKLEGGALLGSILLLIFSIGNFKESTDASAIIMMIVLGVTSLYLAKILVFSFLQQSKETKELKAEGLVDGTQAMTTKISAVMNLRV